MNNTEYLKHIITELSKPIEYKWKLQSYTKDKSKAMCVAYIDARMVTQRLNEVCVHGYHREHFSIGNDVYCRIGLIMPDGTVIWRSDAGESENDTERAKTAASDSFKRAAKEFGLGLFLYELDTVKLPTKQNGNYYDVVDDNGNKIWDLTKHINNLKKAGTNVAPTTPKKTTPKPPKKELDSLEPGTPNWEYSLKRLREGVTIETIEKALRLSKENKAKLLSESKYETAALS